jgi:DeoR/GlpR family transcriptional regulator of sugar metabolism
MLEAQAPRAGFTVILTGGVRTPSAALVGPVADQAIGSLHVDQLFIGMHGMDAAAGLTTPNLAEAQTNRALINSAREVVVLADSTKWGIVGLADFGPLSTADILITDSGLPPAAHETLGEAVGELIVVEPIVQFPVEDRI